MRACVTVLLLCLLSAPTRVLAGEPQPGQAMAFTPPHGALMAAVIRGAIHLERPDGTRWPAQATGTPGKSGGHAVRNGTLIGAGTGALAFSLRTCSVDEAQVRMLGIDPSAYCGSRTGWALVGAAVGAGVGAGVGLLISALSH